MKQTTLDLNGPILSFTTNPVGVASTGVSIGSTGGGTATFTGIATATFPNTASNTGSIAYQWYDQNGAISNGTYVTGAATTTLTISNLITPTDHNRQIYVVADYVPSAYGQGPITAGTARSTGNAINDPISSNVGILTVFPVLSITTQPIETTVIENVTAIFSVVAASSDTSQGTVSYQWSLNGTDLTDSSTVSGSSTPNLNISSSQVGVSTVQVKITNSIASNSPIYSNVVDFGVIPLRKLINIEKYDTTSSTAELSSHDLLNEGEFTILSQYNTSGTSLISLYAPELDINVEMDIYGGAGANSGSYTGGQGGYSRIRFTMKKNEEYTFAGLDIVNKCPFIYRKGSLIAVVGRGGDAAPGGNGGAGGGVNVVGASGGGRGAGSGGSFVSAGTLSPNGIFGSASNLTPISPDTKATGQTGGRTIPCPKGNYWLSQGKSPCSDVGISKIYLGNGTLVSNSASITRGFKSGYDIRQTAGKGQAQFTQQGPYVSRTCYNEGGDRGYRIETRNVTYDAGVVTVNTSPDGSTADVSWNQVRQPPSPYPGNVSGYFIIQRNFPNIDYRSYSIYIDRVKSPTNGSVVSVGSMAAGGATVSGGISVRSLIQQSSNIWELFFQRNDNGLPTFAREFIFRVTGYEDFSVYYDDTYSIPYECGYFSTETVLGGGNGGSGATGGNGGTNSSGGGGGSGYTDGSVTVVSTQQGGSTGDTKVVLRVIN
jgi:hypothetical protein